MKVCIFRATDGACDYYRTILPINTGTINHHFQKRELWISNLLANIQFERKKFFDAMDSDIYFLQRVSGDSIIKKIRDFSKELKIDAKLVMDEDDDVFHVSPFSAHYEEMGLEEMKIVHNGKVVHEWKDGENMNLKENQIRIDGIKRAVAAVDMITTTTEHLANIYREFNPNVKVLPNCVNLNEWNQRSFMRRNPQEIRICWQGGNSHWEDLYLVRDSLKEIANKYPNVKILMVGYMPVSMEKDFRPGQIEFHPWVETPAHSYRMSSLDIDIAIIPLKDTIFNRSKSTIKWIEFASLGIPSITSYVAPYDYIQDVDKVEKGIFVENNDVQGWIKGLELLINNVPMRRSLGENARQFVVNNYDINTQYHQWLNAFKEVKLVDSKQPSIS